MKAASVSESGSIRVSGVGYGYDGESATDVTIRQGSVENKLDFITKQQDIIADEAILMGTEAAMNTANDMLAGVVGGGAAQNIDDIIRYGSKAKGAMFDLGTRAIDGLLGTNTNSIADKWLNRDSQPPITSTLSTGEIDPDSLLARVRQRADPQLSFSYRAFLPQLPELDGTGVFDQNFGRVFNYYVESVDITLPSFADSQTFRAGYNIPYPVFSDNGNLHLTFYGDHHGAGEMYLEAWRSRIMNINTRRFNPASFYKLPICITQVDARNIPSVAYVAIGAFPAGPLSKQLNGSTSEAVKITQEFRVNRIIMIKNDKRKGYAVDILDRPSQEQQEQQDQKLKLGTILSNPKQVAKQLLRF